MSDAVVLIDALADYMMRAPPGMRPKTVRYEAVWLKLDDIDLGGLAVQFVDVDTGRPFAYMHPDDFSQLAFGLPLNARSP